MFNPYNILKDKGRISHDDAVKKANFEYDISTYPITDQLDLSQAIIENIPDQTFDPVILPRPMPKVRLNGVTLINGKDIHYTYINNDRVTNLAVLVVVPSGKGSQFYKGEAKKVFKIK